ncbi:iksA [Symbiodinium natans]|uniref:IksA protein n=1 Tax=Symbiodinium natans TaxID=878477 RepID=A0A812RC54_9DINO|nr:iksA [Symbiodinium natans]
MKPPLLRIGDWRHVAKSSTRGANLFLCTEPAFFCNALGRAFPDRPLIGYFANPLTAYLPAQAAQAWLGDFLSLTRGELPGRTAPFLAVANTRFLAEQMRFQTGARRIFAARPLAAYVGPKRLP